MILNYNKYNKFCLSLCEESYSNEDEPIVFNIIDDIKFFAFKGTSNASDIEHDSCLLINTIPSYYINALNYVLKNVSKKDTIVLTGHSLGGSIAQFINKILTNNGYNSFHIGFNAFNDQSEVLFESENKIRTSIQNMFEKRDYLFNYQSFIDDVLNLTFKNDSLTIRDEILNSSKVELYYRFLSLKTKDYSLSKTEIENIKHVKPLIDLDVGDSFKIQLGTKSIIDESIPNEIKKTNSVISAYINESDYDRIITLISIFKDLINLNLDKVSGVNYIISGDPIANFRKSTVGSDIIFGNSSIPSISYHYLKNFIKYI